MNATSTAKLQIGRMYDELYEATWGHKPAVSAEQSAGVQPLQRVQIVPGKINWAAVQDAQNDPQFRVVVTGSEILIYAAR